MLRIVTAVDVIARARPGERRRAGTSRRERDERAIVRASASLERPTRSISSFARLPSPDGVPERAPSAAVRTRRRYGAYLENLSRVRALTDGDRMVIALKFGGTLATGAS
jgi:hypothetical protein